jgi:hypothetical protein
MKRVAARGMSTDSSADESRHFAETSRYVWTDEHAVPMALDAAHREGRDVSPFIGRRVVSVNVS